MPANLRDLVTAESRIITSSRTRLLHKFWVRLRKTWGSKLQWLRSRFGKSKLYFAHLAVDSSDWQQNVLFTTHHLDVLLLNVVSRLQCAFSPAQRVDCKLLEAKVPGCFELGTMLRRKVSPAHYAASVL